MENQLNILLVGGGGREHALAWKISQSPKVSSVYVAPGNAGIEKLPKCECIKISDDDLQGLLNFAKEKCIDFVFVGPEKPLHLGIVDLFASAGISIMGAHQKAAQLESSKAFAKKIMEKAMVPTADYSEWNDYEKLKKHLSTCDYPMVMKFDGLAAGKGVKICEDVQHALEYAREIFKENRFGNDPLVICEEFLEGRECSVILVTDGKHYQLFESSQDHKRLFDGDKGPNTGGMGAYSPSPIFTPKMKDTVCQIIVDPLMKEFEKQGLSYKGILYIGLMITQKGPKVLEFNVRFGDPETQVLLPRIQNDLMDLFVMTMEGKLSQVTISWTSKACMTVVLAAQGYPDQAQKGAIIEGLEGVHSDLVFHAGTQLKADQIVVSGGRVLAVGALEKDLKACRERAYQEIQNIHFQGMQFRTDIGLDG
ncbi:MAG: phosphoribosylamine--glycine ligase [Bdellovibrionota bacterium]